MSTPFELIENTSVSEPVEASNAPSSSGCCGGGCHSEQISDAEPAAVDSDAPRRNFFTGMFAIFGAMMIFPKYLHAAEAAEKAAAGEASKPATMPTSLTPKVKNKWGMVIDLDKCTGCQGCVVACRAENNVPVPNPEYTFNNRGIFWMDMLQEMEGTYPELHAQYTPIPCNHCENAPCVKVCPVGATYINDEGLVAQIWDRCIGCQYCTIACAYSRRYSNYEAPVWPEDMKNQLNPDVATRPKGVVEKCSFCAHRIRAVKEKARAENRELADSDTMRLTACAQACPAEAITFGNMNDPDSEVSRLGKSPRAYRQLEALGTKPKVIYLREAKWIE